MIQIIQGATRKPVSSQRLAQFFANSNRYDGLLLIGYPIIGTSDGPYSVDSVMLSPDKGLVIFNLIEGRDPLDEVAVQAAQDESFNKLHAKLSTSRTLMDRRLLAVPLTVVTFAPAREDAPAHSSSDYPVANTSNLDSILAGIRWDDSTRYPALVEAIQAISTIRRGRKNRVVRDPTSRGAKLKALEESIANLDDWQGRAVLETVDGVQRIRGLAGSGKTIVLALKAAYLHAQHPDWKIAVTFNTRSLKGQFRQLINTFSIEHTSQEPDWSNVQIVNAWGAPGGGDRDGIYHMFCQLHDLPYYDFRAARLEFGEGKEFTGVCQKALAEMTLPKPILDVILVDEAQDFHPAFFTLCYELLGPTKRLVYAYDELQSLTSQSLPSPEELFGTKPDGDPKVRFEAPTPDMPQQDIILEKCYRNSRPLLVTAHALGFGIYRKPDERLAKLFQRQDTGIVQMFDRPELWLDVGYEVHAGRLEDGSYVKLVRTDRTSPRFLENHSPLS